MVKTIHVDIVSAERALYSGRVEMLIAAGEEGDLGIMPGHSPLLTRLAPGPVRFIKPGGEEEVFYVSGGMLEIQPDLITILADTGVRAHDLDEAAAENARREAERMLSERTSTIDQSMARAELARAIAQLRTIRQLRELIKK